MPISRPSTSASIYSQKQFNFDFLPLVSHGHASSKVVASRVVFPVVALPLLLLLVAANVDPAKVVGGVVPAAQSGLRDRAGRDEGRGHHYRQQGEGGKDGEQVLEYKFRGLNVEYVYQKNVHL